MSELDTLKYYKWVFGTTLLYIITGILGIPGLGSLSWRGISWITMLIVAIVYLLKGKKVTMPYLIWIPWISWVLIYWLRDFTFTGLQASLQYICFPIVGFAASTLVYTNAVMSVLWKWTKRYVIFIIICGTLRIISTPDTVMTFCLFSSLFMAGAFLYGYKISYIAYAVMLLITVSFVTRMGILMMLVVGAFNFANRNIIRKVIFGALIAVTGLIIFYSSAFQGKTFGKEGGTLSDIEFSGGEVKGINTSGREFLWDKMDEAIKEKPWLGYGTRADLAFIDRLGLRYNISEVHNDYKAVTFDYGYMGLSFLLFAFIMQFLLLWKMKSRIRDGATLVIYYGTLTAFLVWIGFMYSDNILKYSIQFGNYHFCMIAIVFSRIKNSLEMQRIDRMRAELQLQTANQ